MDNYKIRIVTYKSNKRVQLELIKNDTKRVARCYNAMVHGQKDYDKWMDLYKRIGQRDGKFTGYEQITKYERITKTWG